MKNIGKVTAVTDGNVQVRIRRKSACEACSSCEFKGSCISGFSISPTRTNITVTARNVISARVGDTVEVSSPTGRMLLLTALIYLLPILLAITSYFLAAKCVSSQLFPYLIALGVLLLSFGLSAFLSDRACAKTVQADAVRIINKEPENQSIPE